MDGPPNSMFASFIVRSAYGMVSTNGRRFLLIFLVGLSALALPAKGDEPFIRFIEGLRERLYFDTASEYIDSMSQRSDLTAEVRDLLDLERGLTLQQKGATSRVPADREQALAEAEVFLRKFVTEKAQHPQAALANSMLGELLFERARSLIWKVAETEAADKKLELQQSARTFVDQAKVIYQTAQDQYKILYDAFPKFIDEAKDEEEYTRRLEAEAKYLRAWFNLVRCTYERGQTFEKGTAERNQTLIQAAELFEKIHTSRRTNQIGLHARLMMGKCFQEQDDIGRALGIYNEMLGHTSENPAVKVLKGIAQHYRLICLNDPQKNDHQLVIQEATAWLQANRQLSTTPSGLGILWEKAIAEEKLGANRELPEPEKEAVLRAAMNDAEQVGKYPGAYKEPASAMSRRLKVVLGEKDREPRDFSTAFERARGMIAQIQQLSDDVAKSADNNERATKKGSLDNHLNEVGRLLRLALDLRDSDSDEKAVAQARYLLSFVLLRQGKALDSMIMSSYCMEHDLKADPDTALNATEIAMAAAVSAWNSAPGKERDFETRALRDVCQRILELYPQSSRGGEARMRLGSVYRTMNEPLEGAKWYLQVPEADPKYASARINAGQSYWTAWTQKAALAAVDPDGATPSVQDMQTWKTEARNLLTQGIQLTRQKLGDMAKPTEELSAAEVSLASILNLDGEFPATIDRLTKGAENSVVMSIEVAEGSARPEEGIQSKSFAGLTYRLLLRAYVGTQQIDQALQTMTKLERVGGEDILAAYTQLGIELQEELKRLKASGENERLAQVRDSFEKFLQKVYESRNKSDYNSLLWIGETYYGLGQGVSGDTASAEGYYSKAGDAYSEIISGGLATAENRNAVQLRLARCRRQQKHFEDALKIVEEILGQNALTLDAQFEAAHILTDWGAESDPTKFVEAVQGKKDATGKASIVWGWSQLARRLQQMSARDPKGELRSRFVDVRYELGVCRRRFANANEKDAVKQRQSAVAEISSFVQAVRDLDDLTFAKFDRLYEDLRGDMGDAGSTLPRLDRNADPAVTEVEPTPAEESTTSGETPDKSVAKAEPAKEDGGSGYLLPLLGLSLCLGVAGGFFVFLRKPRHKVRIPGPSTAPKFSAINVVPEGDMAVVPAGLSFEVPSEPDFAALAGVAGGRKVASTAKPAAAKSVARPLTAENPAKAAPPRPPVPKPKTTQPASAEGSGVDMKPPLPRPPAQMSAGEPSAVAPTANVVPRPAAPKVAVPKPVGSDIAAGEATPVVPKPVAVRPAVPKPDASEAVSSDAKPATPKPVVPRPSAPKPQVPEGMSPEVKTAAPRPPLPKSAGDALPKERPVPRPSPPATAETPEPQKRPKPPESD